MESQIDREADDNGILVFRHAPIGLIYAEQRRIREANEAFAAMFGYSIEELVGASLEMLYPSHDDFERIGAKALRILQRTGQYSDERVMSRRDGRLFWCGVAGRSLTPDDPFARAVWCFVDLSNQWNLANLSARDRQVVLLVCEGHTAKEIARLLGLSPRTVESYLAHLKKTLQVRNVAELVTRARSSWNLALSPDDEAGPNRPS